MPDSPYAVNGFSIFRRERLLKDGGGIMAFVSNDLMVKRRTDLESHDVEAIWLEVYPFKSKSSIILGSVYRPPSSKQANDTNIEANIEGIHLLNKEIIIVSGINIDYRSKSSYKKHMLVKGLKSMHFKQLVESIPRPVSKTCLDHLYCNQPYKIKSVTSHNIGLSDHLPVFAVRKYARKNPKGDIHSKGSRITYRDMKRLNENQLKETLEQAPWETAFVNVDIDDVVNAWEQTSTVLLIPIVLGVKNALNKILKHRG